jgi:hypothetical protein
MAVSAVKDKTPEPEPEKEPFSIDSLTMAETALVESKSGQPITNFGNLDRPQTALIGAVGWVVFRRTDQRITYESYMSSRTMDDVIKELGFNDDDEEADEGKDADSSTSAS